MKCSIFLIAFILLAGLAGAAEITTQSVTILETTLGFCGFLVKAQAPAGYVLQLQAGAVRGTSQTLDGTVPVALTVGGLADAATSYTVRLLVLREAKTPLKIELGQRTTRDALCAWQPALGDDGTAVLRMTLGQVMDRAAVAPAKQKAIMADLVLTLSGFQSAKNAAAAVARKAAIDAEKAASDILK